MMSEVQPVIWHDGREHVLHKHILGLPHLAGRPEAILCAIDKWSAMNDILMTIGAERGDLILDIISEIKPKTMVELGAYIGYSAIKFDQAVRDLGGERYLSLEPNQEYAAIARSMIEFAGLSGFVHVIVGSSSSSLVNLAFAEPTLRIDLLFIDHSGRLYKEDLTLAERSSLLSPHAVVIADNIVDPNASNYVAKMDVRAPDRGSEQAVDEDPQGGERLVYDSRTLSFTLQSGESDAMMVSRRVARE